MAVSADLVQIAIVKETTYGTTPSTPQFEVFPLTGESIVAEVQTTNSALMNASRQVSDSILQKLTATGDLSTELTINPANDILVESAFLEDLVAHATPTSDYPLMFETVIGETQNSFTFERRIPDPATPGSYLYQRATGCVVNTMNMTVSPGEAATVSYGIIGKEVTTASTAIAGATYVEPVNPIVLRGPDTVTVDIASATVSADCAGVFGFNLNNNYRGIQCLGSLGNREMSSGQAEVDISVSFMFSSNDFLDLLIAQTETTVDFEMKTATAIDPGAFFGVYFPRVKITSDNISAGGTGEDVIDDMTMMALYNADGVEVTLGANNYDKTTVRIVTGAGTLQA